MSKRWTFSVVVTLLGILAFWPDPPKSFFNPEAFYPGETEVIFGHFFWYEDDCMYGPTALRLEKGERSQSFGFASHILAVYLRDHCNDEYGFVVDRWTTWLRLGLRPANSELPVIGMYTNPYAKHFGLFNWWGSPILALTIPSGRDPYFAWEASPLCSNPIQSECRLILRSKRAAPTAEALKPTYPEGYHELWDSGNQVGLKFEPLTQRFLRWLLLQTEPSEGSA